MNRKGFTLIELLIVIVMVGILVALISGASIGGGPTRDDALNALHAHGFSDVEIVEESRGFVIGCGEGDIVRFDAVATNVRGDRVNLYVCSGYWKGSTVRTP